MRKRNWARLIQKVWLEDPTLCPACGSNMVVLAAISSAQDDVIERILRSRGEWDPPWQRHRPARGPPTQLDLFAEESAEESGVPEWNPEDENQDPPGDRWIE